MKEKRLWQESKETYFQLAQPIWVKDRETEKNLFVGFRSIVNIDNIAASFCLRITGSSIYRIYVNGEFMGHGPARAAHDFYRVDEWDVRKHIKLGVNLIAVGIAVG